jgi:hypothetical protein
MRCSILRAGGEIKYAELFGCSRSKGGGIGLPCSDVLARLTQDDQSLPRVMLREDLADHNDTPGKQQPVPVPWSRLGP